ncbi:unnamed protein product [Miscanthus lutarioriparius]|uniref:Peptidase A1 domain-containing protein n=1 Tax=Miscanthus lutarioriparius TaxID=422564 RepID=A0A811RUL6_9POAL|nr:unnamed protein product [Miscanthus lutarioriparius]
MAPICSLLFLLLVLPRSTSTAALSKSKPPARYRHHRLRATPLSPDPIARADAAQPLFATASDEASILELDPHDTGNASTVRLLVAHREAFAAPNATAAELLAQRLARDAARRGDLRVRVRVSVPAAAARNVTRRRAAGAGFTAPVVSAWRWAAASTSLRWAWARRRRPRSWCWTPAATWCGCSASCAGGATRSRAGCSTRGGPGRTPPSPAARRPAAASTPGRRRLRPAARDVPVPGRLRGRVRHGGGPGHGDAVVRGRGAQVPRVAVGCGHDNEGLFVASAGLLGLGRGRLSLPTQTARRYDRRFSYCLVDRTSSSSLNRPSSAPRSSTLTFGAGAVPGRASFTPMRDLRLDPSTGRGGVILDSGTSVTRLARPVYAAVREAFRAAAGGLRLAPGGFSLFDTCYDLRGRRVVKVPTVSVHLASGAEVALPPENYLIPVDTRGTFCLALAGTDGGVSIVGNIQQQGSASCSTATSSASPLVPKSC